MGRLDNKTALITGASAGIGRACALAFAREGARIAALARRQDPLEALAAEIARQGGEALALTADVTRANEIDRAVTAAVDRFGPFQILVNSAGIPFIGTAESTTEAEWNRVLAVNLTGTFLVSRAAVPVMRRAGGGSIVNLGSVYGLVARRERAAYAASKGGVTLLTQAMALDHAAEGIRVNCICPALVETELMQRIFEGTPDPAAARRAREAELPLGRLGKPEDVAALALYLASEESGWMTGAAIPLDGGLTAG
jgi:NAD(P)-dependent dehydrogenase (short-subunit alcohol dehydrogenase family)